MLYVYVTLVLLAMPASVLLGNWLADVTYKWTQQ
jgi:hypothetical protein